MTPPVFFERRDRPLGPAGIPEFVDGAADWFRVCPHEFFPLY